MTRVRSFDPRTRRRAASGPDRRPATIRRARKQQSKEASKENNGAKDAAAASETKGKGAKKGKKGAK